MADVEKKKTKYLRFKERGWSHEGGGASSLCRADNFFAITWNSFSPANRSRDICLYLL